MIDNCDIKIGGLEIAIFGRQYPESNDYYDGNWLIITAVCKDTGSEVSIVKQPCLHLSEIKLISEEFEKIYKDMQGGFELELMEPELSISANVEVRGHIVIKIGITPDHLNQIHQYTFTIDQSYIPGIISGLKNVLRNYPLKAVS